MTDWHDAAACRNHPIDLWFPTTAASDNLGLPARTICASCPVREQCLTDNLNAEYGIFGGAGEQRRRALRRAKNAGLTRFTKAVALHFRALDHDRITDAEGVILGSFGDAATHGKRGTYAKRCRCQACVLATAIEGAGKKLGSKGTAA